MLRKIEGKRRKGRQKMRWLNNTINSMDMNLSKLWEIEKGRKPDVLQSMRLQRARCDLATDQQQQTEEGKII